MCIFCFMRNAYSVRSVNSSTIIICSFSRRNFINRWMCSAFGKHQRCMKWYDILSLLGIILTINNTIIAAPYITLSSSGTIPPPPSVLEDKSTSFDGISFTEVYILAPIISVAVLLVCSTMLWVALRKRGMHANNPGRQDQQEEEKTNGRDNRRTCQQVYTSSPVKSSEKLEEENTGV